MMCARCGEILWLHKAPWHWHGRAPYICHWDSGDWCDRIRRALALVPIWRGE